MSEFTREFMQLDPKAPATLEAVVEAVMRLSILSEPQILELVSAGKLSEVFPFRSKRGEQIPPDFVSEEDLAEASATALSPDERHALIQSSMPAERKPRARPSVIRTARQRFLKKFQRSSEESSEE